MAHVTFIHGIANKPPQDLLLDIWIDALASDGGLDLDSEGVSSTMVYWADVMYASPAGSESAQESLSQEDTDPVIDGGDWQQQLTADQRQWLDTLVTKLGIEAAPPGGDDSFTADPSSASHEFEAIPLPWWLKRRLMRTLLRDVHHYLFAAETNPRPGETYQVQPELRSRFTSALEEGAAQSGPHVVVSHSMGTVIAYDCLKQVEGCPGVDALLTLGSPLGLEEMQTPMKPGYSRQDGFPSERVSGRWVNIYDRLDPVAGLDPKLANDYRRAGDFIVEDINQQSSGSWRHSITKYLAGSKLRPALAELLEL